MLISWQMMMSLMILRQNMRQKCEKINIVCAKWNFRQSMNHVRMLLVIFEIVHRENFVRFVIRMQIRKRLNRIVIDECHVVLNDDFNFRQCLRQLRKLNRLQMSIFLLIVILSSMKKNRFLRRMWFRFDEI